MFAAFAVAALFAGAVILIGLAGSYGSFGRRR